MAYRFIAGTRILVVSQAHKTVPVELMLGMPEGRRLSPAFYIARGSTARRCMKAPMGIGLDPSGEPVAAFHTAKDGTDAQLLDSAECEHLMLKLECGGSECDLMEPWQSAMALAGHDTSRLHGAAMGPNGGKMGTRN